MGNAAGKRRSSVGLPRAESRGRGSSDSRDEGYQEEEDTEEGAEPQQRQRSHSGKEEAEGDVAQEGNGEEVSADGAASVAPAGVGSTAADFTHREQQQREKEEARMAFERGEVFSRLLTVEQSLWRQCSTCQAVVPDPAMTENGLDWICGSCRGDRPWHARLNLDAPKEPFLDEELGVWRGLQHGDEEELEARLGLTEGSVATLRACVELNLIKRLPAGEFPWEKFSGIEIFQGVKGRVDAGFRYANCLCWSAYTTTCDDGREYKVLIFCGYAANTHRYPGPEVPVPFAEVIDWVRPATCKHLLPDLGANENLEYDELELFCEMDVSREIMVRRAHGRLPFGGGSDAGNETVVMREANEPNPSMEHAESNRLTDTDLCGPFWRVLRVVEDLGTVGSLVEEHGSAAFGEDACRRIARQLLDALLYLQSQGFYHYGWGPFQVRLVDPAGTCQNFSEGIPQLCQLHDFSNQAIDQMVSSTGSQTGTQLRAGNLRWGDAQGRFIAPEVVKSDSAVTRTELEYSAMMSFPLGCTLSVMLVGTDPWKAWKFPPLRALFLLATKDADATLLDDASCSDDSRQFVLRSIAKDPDERATLEELRALPFVSLPLVKAARP